MHNLGIAHQRQSRNTGSQGRRAKTLSRALDADSEAAPVRRAAGERGRRSIAARGERLHHLRLIRTLHPRARACSVRAREDGLAGWCGPFTMHEKRKKTAPQLPRSVAANKAEAAVVRWVRAAA